MKCQNIELKLIDENNSFWIIVDDGRFIRNPTQEDLKGVKIIYYSKDNICPRCRDGMKNI
jgi:hypothetical protein